MGCATQGSCPEEAQSSHPELGASGHYDLAHVDPGHCALALSRGTAHTCLEPVRSDQLQRGQCLVDSGDVDGVELHADTRAIFAQLFTRSKMWIVASGTLQQKRDFAYSLFLRYRYRYW
ncbi:hypothetical protein AB1E18_008995 [Capra hircus]